MSQLSFTINDSANQAPPDTSNLPVAEVVEQQGDAATIRVDTTQQVNQDQQKPATQEEETKQQQEEEPKEKPEASPEENTQEKRAEEAVSKAGLDMAALSKEYAENGQLSEESLAKLEQAGITRDVVDAYIEGQKARAEAFTLRLSEYLGGRQNLEATLEWASKSLSQEEIAAANEVLQSGNEAQARLLLDGLNRRRLESVGREPSLASGRAMPGAGAGGIRPYESTAQMIEDMRSEKYHRDPAFRAQVERRIAVTNF